jgi:hypothetical protein
MAGIQPQNGFVVNPYTISYTDNAPPTLGQGGEQLVSLKGGKYAAAALRGQVFCATTSVAHTFQAFSNASQLFAVVNPIGSGINVELVRSDFTCILAASGTVNGLGLYFSTATQIASWTGLTATPTLSGKCGTGSGKAIFYSALTQTGNTPVLQAIIGGWGAVNTLKTLGLNSYNFDGAVVIPQGVGVTISMTSAAGPGAGTMGVLTWLEYAA